MKRWMPSIVCAVAALLAGVTPATVKADRGSDQDRGRLSVTVAFGAGLNTPGAANHHILPPTIRVAAGGVVNFVVAGFHQIFVYNQNIVPDDIVVPPTGTFIDFDLPDLYYKGLSPAGAPPTGFSNLNNRVESVFFADPGTYLVICNVRGHFLNGMYAFVQVGDEDGEHHHEP
jgi:plastocyanin